jgi:hypothetical protein
VNPTKEKQMDSVYRSDKDEEADTPAPTTDLPIESWSDFRKQLEEANDISHDSLTLEQAANETTRRRQEFPTPENSSDRPIVVHKLAGDGPKTLREATDDLAYSRGLQMRDDLLTTGHSEQEIQRLAMDKLEQAERGDPFEEPPAEFKDEDRWGAKTEELTASEAADKISLWRQQQAAERAQELAELTGRHEEQQAQSEQPQQPAQQQPQQQPTPAQLERHQLAQERQSLALLRQMDAQEAQLHSGYQNLANRVLTDFPSLRNGPPNPADLEDLRQKAPARFQQLIAADAALKQYQLQLNNFAQQRGQRSQAAAQQRANARARQDHAFEEKAARLIPNWEHVGPEVRQQAHRTLQDAGMSPEEIQHLWTGDHSIDAHSSVLQLVLAKAAMWDNAHAKAQQIRQAPMPKVVRPGTSSYNRGSDYSGVSEIRTQMKSAKGNQGIALATRLIKAQRAANRG